MRRLPPNVRIACGIALAAALVLAAPASATDSPSPPPASSAVAPEAALAAFLLNFLRFTEWPARRASPDTAYTIGISGNRALEDELLRLGDRQLVRGHRLRVVRLKSAADLADVHAVYFDAVGEAEPDALAARDALARLRTQPVLTVSDSPRFTEQGGVIRLFREEKALRFEVSPEAAREAGLVLSSRLLSLARIYRPAPGPTPAPAP